MNNFNDFAPIQLVEWDFDSVPDEELKTCLVWELAHESTTISNNTRRLRLQPLTRATHWDPELMREVPNSTATRASAETELKTIPEISEETMCAEIDASMQGSDFYSWILTFGGSHTRHWQELPNDVRADLVKKDNQWMLYPRCAPARLGELETLWQQYAPELEAMRSDKNVDEESIECHLVTTEIRPADTTFENDESSAQDTHRMTAALTMDFRRFTDQEIIQAFAGWLKAIRPCPAPVKRGKKHNDARAALDGLGVMRLLQWYRIDDDAFPERFRRRGKRACYKLRQLAFERFYQVFPFIPKEQKPASWTTWSVTEKMCLEIEKEMAALDVQSKEIKSP